jgi:hypothetical protein
LVLVSDLAFPLSNIFLFLSPSFSSSSSLSPSSSDDENALLLLFDEIGDFVAGFDARLGR